MITGDNPTTAIAIAREAGLEHTATAATGRELELLDDSALLLKVRETDVFARIRPEQKLRLVQALKSLGEVIAMGGAVPTSLARQLILYCSMMLFPPSSPVYGSAVRSTTTFARRVFSFSRCIFRSPGFR